GQTSPRCRIDARVDGLSCPTQSIRPHIEDDLHVEVPDLVLATTRSPILLAHLSPESLANVVALGRDATGTTICERIGKLPYFATLRNSDQLDHLISTGWLESAL